MRSGQRGGGPPRKDEETREHPNAITGIHTRTLSGIHRQAEGLNGLRKADLRAGDRVIVRTRNSSYVLCFLGEDRFRVSGGWFDRNGPTPVTITVTGCTWGGSAIKTDLVASRGLFLEFGNQVLTTRIQDFRLIRASESPTIH
jgi:hypothetical protein